MTKRSQTTGLPKQSPKQSAQPEKPKSSGRFRFGLKTDFNSRAERDAYYQRIVVLGVGLVVAVTILILAAVVISEFIITPNQTVATVAGHNITLGEFQKRVRLDRFVLNSRLSQVVSQYQSFGIPDDQILPQLQQDPSAAKVISQLQVPDQMGLAVMDEMVEEQLIRVAAEEKGISVTQADIDNQVNRFFGYDPSKFLTPEATAEVTATLEPTATPTPYVSPTPSPTPTTTPTPELTPTTTLTPAPTLAPVPTLNATEQADNFKAARDNGFASIRQATGLTDKDINGYFEILALRQALQDSVTADVTKTGMFINARHILVATEEEANDVMTALQAGESFTELAKSVSTDTGSGSQGGELGWNPITIYVAEFADAARTAEIGAFVGPVKTQFGYHIIQVRAREDREMTSDQIDTAKANEFDTWLKAYKESKKDQVETFTTWAGHVPTDPVSIVG